MSKFLHLLPIVANVKLFPQLMSHRKQPKLLYTYKKILWDNSEISREEDVCLFDSGWNLDQDVSAHLLDVLIWLPIRTTAHAMCYNYTTIH